MKIKTAFSKIGFWTKKNGPELLTIGGIACSAASVYFAIKAAKKSESILKPINNRIDRIHKDMKDDNLILNNQYSVEQGKKDLAKAYLKAAWELIKLYGPCALSFTMSTAALLTSHKIMKGRQLALAAAYTTVESGYKAYRERVKAKVGEKVEDEIYRDIREEEVNETITDKNGKEKEVTKKVQKEHYTPDEDFKYMFDASNPNWNNDSALNIDWLLMTRKFLDDQLRVNGYLFMSDVYEQLGIEPCYLTERQKQMSRVVGWIYDPEDKSRDNWVSFGICDRLGNLTAQTAEFRDLGEKDYLLCFNPDGDILTGENNGKTFMKYAK